MEIAVIGSSKFTLGFRLAGINRIYEPSEKVMDTIEKIKQDKEIGIVIVDDETIFGLKDHERYGIDRSVKPVFIIMSENASQDNLRRLIIKAIGIDVLKE